MDVIIPTNLICALFGVAIPTSSFYFIQLFFYNDPIVSPIAILDYVPYTLSSKSVVSFNHKNYNIAHCGETC